MYIYLYIESSLKAAGTPTFKPWPLSSSAGFTFLPGVSVPATPPGPVAVGTFDVVRHVFRYFPRLLSR